MSSMSDDQPRSLVTTTSLRSAFQSSDAFSMSTPSESFFPLAWRLTFCDTSAGASVTRKKQSISGSSYTKTKAPCSHSLPSSRSVGRTLRLLSASNRSPGASQQKERTPSAERLPMVGGESLPAAASAIRTSCLSKRTGPSK